MITAGGARQIAILSQPKERILEELYRYLYLTNEQIQRLFYAGRDLRNVQRRTAALAAQGLLEFIQLPPEQGPHGTGEKVYALSWKGFQYLAASDSERFPLPKRYHRGEVVGMKPGPLRHLLAINDVLISLELLCQAHPEVQPQTVIHERELNRQRVYVDIEQGVDRQKVKRAVIPDGWVHLRVEAVPGYETWIAFEVDRATETNRTKWAEKIAALVAWWMGPYRDAFHTNRLVIAILAVEGGVRRRDELRRWTEGTLERLEHEEKLGRRTAWKIAPLFLIAEGKPDTLAPDALFAEARWYAPFADVPVPLLPDLAE